MLISGRLVTQIHAFRSFYKRDPGPVQRSFGKSECIGTLIEGIHDDINGRLAWQLEHLPQTFRKCMVTRLLRVSVVLRYKPAKIRFGTKLGKQ